MFFLDENSSENESEEIKSVLQKTEPEFLVEEVATEEIKTVQEANE